MKRKQSNLRDFLDKSVERAKHNTHTGDVRTHDLQVELERIGKRVKVTLARIKSEAGKSESPDDDAKALSRIEQTMEILTGELMMLSGVYHRQKDISAIRHFLNEQKDVVQKAMYDDTAADADHAKSLDGRIVELHGMMSAERKRISRAGKTDQLKFYISISIAVISLSISIYALWLR